MADKEKEQSSCGPPGDGGSCCKVEALVSVDERGQMVIPKETRTLANIRPGDKLALISWQKDGEICCLCLVKAEEMAGMVRGLLGPMMQDLAP